MSMSPARYGLSLRITHWATVVAVLAAYLFANMGEGSEEGGVATSGMQAMQWHYVAGIIVLLFVIPRLVLRIYAPTPPIVPAPGSITALTARLVHLALYVFLIVQPVLGWLQLSYGGEQVVVPWLDWHLPALVHPDAQAKEIVGEVHELIGNVFYAVIALHILAALWHHFMRRDNTLKRML
ncbi:cytochrome b [Dyella sp.]|uniref:cytochrome b n=1 Tax=Dyella sp. TaxID=1869338 RepID=UPI002D7A1165|nr:cytochrome b [Dyella sp.]HET7330788.1 cytochrome b [Dyella sp.]